MQASIAKLVEKADTYVASTNYRCGDAIVANAQYTVDMLGVDVTLSGATGHVGVVVENATLAAYPFKTKSSSILVLFRKTHDGFAFYKVACPPRLGPPACPLAHTTAVSPRLCRCSCCGGRSAWARACRSRCMGSPARWPSSRR